MKKTVLIFALTVLVVFSAFGASAADYYPAKDSFENYSYTVRCDVSKIEDIDMTQVEKGVSMYGLVAVLGTGSEVSVESADDFVYIDQATVDANGIVTFSGFLPMGPTPDQYVEEGEEPETGVEYFEECTLFIGGAGLASAKEIGVLKDAGSVPDDFPVNLTVKDSDQRTGVVSVKVFDAQGNQVGNTYVSTVSSGAFSVNVPTGTGYSFEFTKTNYCKYTLTGVDVAGEVTLPEVDMTTLAGNTDGIDGINFYDLSAVLSNFGASGSVNDTTGDGNINFYDLSAVLGNFGRNDVTQAYTAE